MNIIFLIHNMYVEYVPLIRVSNKKNAPWLNRRLKNITRTKNRKWKKCERNNSERNYIEYRNYCKTVKSAEHEERLDFE